MDLVPALPDGPATKFEAGDVSLTAMELAAKLGNEQEFPYDTPRRSSTTLSIDGLEAKGMI